MKKLFVILILLLNTNVFSQTTGMQKPFLKYGLDVFGGTIFSSSGIGPSFLLEGKVKLTSDINIKLSLGYSEIYYKGFYSEKGYEDYPVFNSSTNKFDPGYEVYSFNSNKRRYMLVPLSLGIEYYFSRSILSPYCSLEAGYYWISTVVYSADRHYGAVYNSLDEIPSEYKISKIKPVSYNIGLGIGTQYMISKGINLDIRYVYHFNSQIINSNQFLVGISFD